jgi:hypothetical protein
VAGWGWVIDTAGSFAIALARLGLVLDAASASPTAAAVLPERSSRILDAAAAALFGLPATDFDPGTPLGMSLRSPTT